MKKRIIALLMAVVLISTFAVTACTASSNAEQSADALYTLGLFHGIGDINGVPTYSLDSELTRAQAIILLVRMLGKEKEALNGNWEHPFKDTEEYYDKYVGYAYAKGLTKGVSENAFDGSFQTNNQMFATFCIRALGYKDKTSEDDENGDFWWADSPKYAEALGITISNDNEFKRSDAVQTFWDTLSKNINGTDKSMAEKLIEEGVFTKAQYDKAVEISTGKAVPDYKMKETEVEGNNTSSSKTEVNNTIAPNTGNNNTSAPDTEESGNSSNTNNNSTSENNDKNSDDNIVDVEDTIAFFDNESDVDADANDNKQSGAINTNNDKTNSDKNTDYNSKSDSSTSNLVNNSSDNKSEPSGTTGNTGSTTEPSGNTGNSSSTTEPSGNIGNTGSTSGQNASSGTNTDNSNNKNQNQNSKAELPRIPA